MAVCIRSPVDDLGRLWHVIGELQERMETCHRESAELREESTALRECLAESGTLSLVSYLARLHRRRFAAASAAHPVGQGQQLADVMSAGSIAFKLGLYTGPSEVRALGASSQVISRTMLEVLPRIRSVYPGYIYVHGGYDGQRRLLSIECWTPSAGVWEVLPPMKDNRTVVAAVVIASKLYVCGGWDGEQRLRVIERYDMGACTWEALPPMEERRSHPAVANLIKKVPVINIT